MIHVDIYMLSSTETVSQLFHRVGRCFIVLLMVDSHSIDASRSLFEYRSGNAGHHVSWHHRDDDTNFESNTSCRPTSVYLLGKETSTVMSSFFVWHRMWPAPTECRRVWLSETAMPSKSNTLVKHGVEVSYIYMIALIDTVLKSIYVYVYNMETLRFFGFSLHVVK